MWLNTLLLIYDLRFGADLETERRDPGEVLWIGSIEAGSE